MSKYNMCPFSFTLNCSFECKRSSCAVWCKDRECCGLKNIVPGKITIEVSPSKSSVENIK